jgi:hypothetical protein
MDNNLVPYDPKKIELIKREGEMPLPYSNEIFLMDCHIAGTSYVDDMDALFPGLQIGQKLLLRREASNEHDGLAILVLTESNQKLGYIPRAQNEVVSRLLDAGKMLFGRITFKEDEYGWKKIDIKVFMRDL